MIYHYARRGLIFCAFVLAAIPITFIGIRHVRAKVLYEGDIISERTCRECAGSGKWVELEEASFRPAGGRCPGCGGDGVVDVILPGPSRPTRVQGMVAERIDLGDESTYATARPHPMKGSSGVRGVAGAKITFEGICDPIEVVANPLGLFNLKLAPGHYRVTIESPRHTTLRSELEVPVLTDEIWLTEARIVYEPSSLSEAQALFGFEILAGLDAPQNGPGIFISCFGGPMGGLPIQHGGALLPTREW
jgi:hypothetical protein